MKNFGDSIFGELGLYMTLQDKQVQLMDLGQGANALSAVLAALLPHPAATVSAHCAIPRACLSHLQARKALHSAQQLLKNLLLGNHIV